MSSGNAPHPDVLELNLLRTLAQQDVIVDLDAPEDAIALAQSFGTNVEGLGQARQRLGQFGFATVVQVTNRRVRASITPGRSKSHGDRGWAYRFRFRARLVEALDLVLMRGLAAARGRWGQN